MLALLNQVHWVKCFQDLAFVLWTSTYKVTCYNGYVQTQMFIADVTESNTEIIQH